MPSRALGADPAEAGIAAAALERDDVVGLELLLSIAEPIDAFADAAKIVMKPTSETAIITAAPVVAVRRVPGRVLAREAAHDPPQPRERHADHVPVRANSGDTSTKTPTSTAAHRCRRARCRCRRTGPRRASQRSRGANRPPMPSRAETVDRAFERDRAHRRDRRDARRLAGRDRRGQDRDDRADEQPDDHRNRPQHDAVARDPEAQRVHETLEPDREARPAATPIALASEADDDRLTDHRPEHLSSSRADRAQQAPSPACAARRRSRTCCR